MLIAFCLRLAFGLLVTLLPLWPFPLNPRFYRAHFLTALALSAGAFVLLVGFFPNWAWLVFWPLMIQVVLFVLGSMAWLLEDAPGGRFFVVLGTLVSGLSLFLLRPVFALSSETDEFLLILTDEFSSALLLGAATTAMLLGHSYLIAPGLSIRPLTVALAVLGGALLLRCGVAGLELWSWTNTAPSRNLETEAILWLAVRWGVGLLAPLVLGWMAWETARIRSTQSATGILYVVVICCFLGELTGVLLLEYMKA